MEPMNAFLTTHRDAFKTFIDDVCSVPTPNVAANEKPASYSTPLAIQSRLPMTSREGFPSLPYLIDQSREYAGLVELWLQGTGDRGSPQIGHISLANQIGKEDGDLLTFHKACVQLHVRTQECLSRAERAERPNSALSFRWEELIEQLQGATGLDSRPGSQDQDPAAHTRDSFDDVASRAAGSDLPAGTRRNRGLSNGTNAGNRGGVLLQATDVPTLSSSSSDVETTPPNWENDRDGGAASVAASLQTLEAQQYRKSSVGVHSVRSGGSSIDTSRPSLRDGVHHRGLGHSNSITIGVLQRDGTTATLPNLPSHHSHSNRLERDNVSMSNSMMSATDSDTTTALPSLERERERKMKEKKVKEKEKKEERERRLKDFVPGLMGKRKKDKEKEAT